MTNKKFKKAAMALALTACVAATPLAANAETPENAVPVENKERSEAETPAQQASESANTAPVENQEHENAEGILEDRETEDKKITTDVEYTDREFTYNEDGTVKLVIAGADIPGLTWVFGKAATEAGEVDGIVINYYTQALYIVPTEKGCDMDYFGSMLIHFAPEESAK